MPFLAPLVRPSEEGTKGGKSGEGLPFQPAPSFPLFLSVCLPACKSDRLRKLSRTHRMPPFDLNSHFGEEGTARALQVSLHLAIARQIQLYRQIFCKRIVPKT